MDTTVHDVLGAISEAKAALDREPQLKAQVDELTHKLNDTYRHSQELELHIVEYKKVIEDLQSKVRSLEVERDDMGFRQLVAEDKLDSLRHLVQEFTAKAAEHMPKPEPVNPIPTLSEMQEVATTAVGSSSNPSPEPSPTVHSDPSSGYSQEVDPDTVGQSASPLPPKSAVTSTSQEEPVNTAGDTTIASASTSNPKRYEGKTYTQVFGHLGSEVGLSEWVAKGGNVNNWYR